MLIFCGYASADGGAFSNVQQGSGQYDQWYVDVTATSDTCPTGTSGYCGWFPVAYVVSAAQQCSNVSGSYVWVGTVYTDKGTQTTTHDGFYAPSALPLRFCLYLTKAGKDQLTAEAVWDGVSMTPVSVPGVPQPPPPPAPSPAPAAPVATPPATAPSPQEAYRCSDFSYQEQAQDALDEKPALAPTLDANGDGIACAQLPHQFATENTTVYHRSSLSKSAAAAGVRHALWKRYGDSFTARRGYRRSCGRISRTRVRCRVAWTTRKSSYRGKVTIWTTVTSSGERHYHWAIRVRRHSLAPKPAPKPVSPSNPGGGGGGGGGGCDPNYSGACLDPNAYDYDCIGGSGDGPSYTGTVVVVGSDHYGLDADGNGIGCE